MHSPNVPFYYQPCERTSRSFIFYRIGVTVERNIRVYPFYPHCADSVLTEKRTVRPKTSVILPGNGPSLRPIRRSEFRNCVNQPKFDVFKAFPEIWTLPEIAAEGSDPYTAQRGFELKHDGPCPAFLQISASKKKRIYRTLST